MNRAICNFCIPVPLTASHNRQRTQPISSLTYTRDRVAVRVEVKEVIPLEEDFKKLIGCRFASCSYVIYGWEWIVIMLRLERFYCQLCENFVPSCLCHVFTSHSWLDEESRAVVVEGLCSSGYLLFSAESHALHFTQDLHRCSSLFFASPLEVKTTACSKDKARRGYSPLETDNFAALVGEKGKPNDSVEKYRFGPTVGLHEFEGRDESYFSSKAAKVHFFPNATESLDQNYQKALEQYYKLMEKLSLCILYIIEAAFHLEEGSLAIPSKPPYHTSILSINHYPLDSSNQCGVERVAEHTDVSLFTIVTELGQHDCTSSADDTCDFAKRNTQLQIENRITKDWLDINLGPEQFLVNIGDYLEYISQGRLHSARHRVISQRNGSVPRESFAYFCTPRYDAVIDWKKKEQVSHSDNDEEGGTHSVSIQCVDKPIEDSCNGGYTRGLSYHEFRKAKIAKVVNALKSSK